MPNPNKRNESVVNTSGSNNDYLALQPRQSRAYYALVNSAETNDYNNEASVTDHGYLVPHAKALLPTGDVGDAHGAEKLSKSPIHSDCKGVPMEDDTTNGASHYINEASITKDGYLAPISVQRRLQPPNIHDDADPMSRLPNACAKEATIAGQPICNIHDASATEDGNIVPVSKEPEGALNLLNILDDEEPSQSPTVSDGKSEDDYLVPKPCRSHSYLELQDVDYDEI